MWRCWGPPGLKKACFCGWWCSPWRARPANQIQAGNKRYGFAWFPGERRRFFIRRSEFWWYFGEAGRYLPPQNREFNVFDGCAEGIGNKTGIGWHFYPYHSLFLLYFMKMMVLWGQESFWNGHSVPILFPGSLYPDQAAAFCYDVEDKRRKT